MPCYWLCALRFLNWRLRRKRLFGAGCVLSVGPIELFLGLRVGAQCLVADDSGVFIANRRQGSVFSRLDAPAARSAPGLDGHGAGHVIERGWFGMQRQDRTDQRDELQATAGGEHAADRGGANGSSGELLSERHGPARHVDYLRTPRFAGP